MTSSFVRIYGARVNRGLVRGGGGGERAAVSAYE